MKRKNKKHNIFILLTIIVMLILLDLYNLPTRLGFPIQNINHNYMNIIVTITLFIIGYFLINKRMHEKEYFFSKYSILKMFVSLEEYNFISKQIINEYKRYKTINILIKYQYKNTIETVSSLDNNFDIYNADDQFGQLLQKINNHIKLTKKSLVLIDELYNQNSNELQQAVESYLKLLDTILEYIDVVLELKYIQEK